MCLIPLNPKIHEAGAIIKQRLAAARVSNAGGRGSRLERGMGLSKPVLVLEPGARGVSSHVSSAGPGGGRLMGHHTHGGSFRPSSRNHKRPLVVLGPVQRIVEWRGGRALGKEEEGRRSGGAVPVGGTRDAPVATVVSPASFGVSLGARCSAAWDGGQIRSARARGWRGRTLASLACFVRACAP